MLLKNVLPKGNFLLLLEGMNAAKKCISGVFCSTALGSEKHQSQADNEDWYFQEGASYFRREEDCFMFYYEDNFCMHFPLPPTSGPFGCWNATTDDGMHLSFSSSS
jgi:hypothetical protein